MVNGVVSSAFSAFIFAAMSWVDDIAAFPIAFSQVREDPRIDRQLLQGCDGQEIVLIASGGDTAAVLAAGNLRRMHLVDANPAQLALTQLKQDLLANSASSERLTVLGHLECAPQERVERMNRVCGRNGIDPAIFGPIAEVQALGVDHCGRYEQLFAKLADAIRGPALSQLLNLADSAAQAAALAPESALGRHFDAAIADVMGLPNLVRLFGEGATQNPQQSFCRHFADRTRAVLATQPACENPFLWQMLSGRFPAVCRYDWLDLPQQPISTECVYHHALMTDVLADLPAGSCAFVHLSNILDWLDPVQAEHTLAAARRVLAPNGMVLIRQLNSTLDIPTLSGFTWDRELGKELLTTDRSFFYKAIHVGRKQ
ncbi:MAG: S-adenosylmethionine-diacylglycerol 3-amino-3-carboxypropyl transferase [Rhodothermales bacterium]|jgi:S-adenosylmethionine-diacylglycerol 3-amino-3-carboxypropyl transferase